MSEIYSKYEALAIAYLTGQATPAEVSDYRELYANDPGFKEIVDDVETWLAPLKADVADQTPPDGLLDDIMGEIASIEDEDATIPAHKTANPESKPLPANDGHPAPANDNPSGKWRTMASASSIVAVLAVGSHFITPNRTTVPQSDTETFMALLSDASQPELMAIVYNPKTGKVVARLSNITVPDDGDLQLWVIREGESAPVSLGVLNKVDEVDRIELLSPLALNTGTDTLAVSLEEKGGSKSAGPEGPVLYTGAVSSL